jgi:hypothetical protein
MPRRTTIAALLIAGGLVAQAAPARAQQAGVYDVTGTNLDGTDYVGVAQIRTTGLASFAIRWVIANSVIEGVGFASGRTVSVAYGLANRPGIGIYALNPDGSMEGEWTIIGAAQNGRERLVPRKAPAAASPLPAPASPAPALAAPAPDANPPAAIPPALPAAPASPTPAPLSPARPAVPAGSGG